MAKTAPTVINPGAVPDTLGGRKYSKQLFKQFNTGDCVPIYDLDEFHQVFLEEADLTEYRAAIRLVGTWTEWQRIKRDWYDFPKMIEAWKDEVETKLRSQALDKLVDLMASARPETAASIAKFIAQSSWDRGKAKVSEKEASRSREEAFKKASVTSEEAARITTMLTLIGEHKEEELN